MPPGTGDVQLTICQDLQLSGTISVSTPSKLAVADAVKGVEMFDSLGVPTLAVVENMAYFKCEGGAKHYPFGKGLDIEFLASKIMTENTSNQPPIIQLPISELTNSSNDSGTPITLLRPPNAKKEVSAFDKLAKIISESLLQQHYKEYHGKNESSDNDGFRYSTIDIHGKAWDVSSLQLTLDIVNERFIVRLYSDTGATELGIFAEDLRLTHPKTGALMKDPSVIGEHTVSSGGGCGGERNQHHHEAISKDNMVRHHTHKHGLEVNNTTRPKKNNLRLFPATIEKRGHYGYAVEWADGATIIYSKASIANAVVSSNAKLESFLG